MFDRIEPLSSPGTDLVSRHPRIAAVATALPVARLRQGDIYRHMASRVPEYRNPVVEGIFAHAGLNHRHVALMPDALAPAPPADELHAGFERHALELAESAARRALETARLGPADIAGLVVATSTGYLCPGVAARVAPRLGLAGRVMRTEIVGAGCAGALPALQRAHDYLCAHPDRRVLVVCVEVCSACVYVDDDLETAVGNAICADGAAAIVLEGGAVSAEGVQNAETGPRLCAFETAADPQFLRSVGFARREGRLRIVLSRQIPDIASGPVREAVSRSLAQEGLGFDDVDHWVVHSGGRRVLDRLSDGLGLDRAALDPSRAVLADCGNMSSPTVLFVLERTMAARRPRPGAVGALVALGPGLVDESALLRW